MGGDYPKFLTAALNQFQSRHVEKLRGTLAHDFPESINASSLPEITEEQVTAEITHPKYLPFALAWDLDDWFKQLVLAYWGGAGLKLVYPRDYPSYMLPEPPCFAEKCFRVLSDQSTPDMTEVEMRQLLLPLLDSNDHRQLTEFLAGRFENEEWLSDGDTWTALKVIQLWREGEGWTPSGWPDWFTGPDITDFDRWWCLASHWDDCRREYLSDVLLFDRYCEDLRVRRRIGQFRVRLDTAAKETQAALTAKTGSSVNSPSSSEPR